MVRDVADVVEGERHGLQGGELAQSLHRHLRQSVIVQPQVTERAHPGEAAGGDIGDVVGVQTTAETVDRARVCFSQGAEGSAEVL